jgi:hypothetical protein
LLIGFGTDGGIGFVGKKRKNKTASKSKSTGKYDVRRKEARRARAAEFEAGLLGKARKPRDDRHVLVALTIASLVAGLLFVINFDRTTHSAAALEMGKGTSLHGWPFIYLHREFESLPAYLIATRISEWPIPAVDGETRTMNYQNLALDILCCGVIVILSYFVVRYIVFRYDQWKKTWS